MPRKFRVFSHKGQAELIVAAMQEPDYKPGLLNEIVSRLSKTDQKVKHNEAIVKRNAIDTILGYPMETTLYALALIQHPNKGEWGMRIKPVHTARTSELVDVEILLETEDIDNLNENWLPEETE